MTKTTAIPRRQVQNQVTVLETGVVDPPNAARCIATSRLATGQQMRHYICLRCKHLLNVRFGNRLSHECPDS
jgi:transposase-like protein